MKNFDPSVPFNDLDPIPPKIDLETPQILKACIKANKELAQLKIAERLIPNQKVLISCIPILESQASSAIENIVTTTDELFEHAHDYSSPVSSATKETLRYKEALYKGYLSIKERPLSIETIRNICSTIRSIETNVRTLYGTALINDITGKHIYTPPDNKDKLKSLLFNWQEYIHEENDDIDPLIKLAVQHYQFEAIHPFPDGNGRTGRIVNLLYLIQRELLDTPILYLSGYIIKNKSEYYRRLIQVTTKNAWQEWILYFLNGIFETSRWTINKIFAIRTLIKDTATLIKSQAPSIYNKEFIELLFIEPYVSINTVVKSEIIGRDTASKYLKKLCELKILEEKKRGRRKLFINKKFLDLLQKK